MFSLAAQPWVSISVIFVLRVKQIDDGSASINFAPGRTSVKNGYSTSGGEAIINPANRRHNAFCPTM